MRVGCKARTQTNTRRPLQAGEMGTPPPRSEQPHTMSNRNPNGIRAHNDRHTIANDPDNLRTHEQPHPERHPGRTPTATPSPRRAFAYMISQS